MNDKPLTDAQKWQQEVERKQEEDWMVQLGKTSGINMRTIYHKEARRLNKPVSALTEEEKNEAFMRELKNRETLKL